MNIGSFALVTDYVANGSFASLKSNVNYQTDGHAVLVRLVDHNSKWLGDRVYVTEHAYQFLRKSSLEADDIVVANVGANAGTVFRVPKLDRPCTLGPNAILVRSARPEEVNNDFLFYYLSSAAGQNLIRAIISGSAQPKFNKTDFRRIVLQMPLPEQQVRVAFLLRALDSRIKLLSETQSSIEHLSHALFNSWFVNFDPVRAKAEGREPEGMDAATAALFPSSFKSGIPLSWQVKSIYDLADVIYGAPFASSEFKVHGEGLPLIRIRDLKTQSPDVFTLQRHPKGELVHAGDILVGMDGEFRAGYWLGEDGWLNQRVCKFEPKSSIPRAFLLQSIVPLLAFVERSETATTVIHLGKADIDRFLVLRPPDDLLRHFDDICEPLVLKLLQIAVAARTLTKLRDTLLPRLISGKLRIPDAEKLVASAL